MAKNWERGRGEASHLSNLRISTNFLDPDYEIIDEDLMLGETRLLKVFSLLPKTSGKPSFHARVDDGSPDKPKQPELDIDIKGVPAAIVGDFKAGRNGYKGHHNDRSPNRTERIFDVEIAIPTGSVFKGEVFFNAAFSVAINIGVSSSFEATATVTRATRLERLLNFLKQMCQRLW
jgi:hypothetical protein